MTLIFRQSYHSRYHSSFKHFLCLPKAVSSRAACFFMRLTHLSSSSLLHGSSAELCWSLTSCHHRSLSAFVLRFPDSSPSLHLNKTSLSQANHFQAFHTRATCFHTLASFTILLLSNQIDDNAALERVKEDKIDELLVWQMECRLHFYQLYTLRIDTSVDFPCLEKPCLFL